VKLSRSNSTRRTDTAALSSHQSSRRRLRRLQQQQHETLEKFYSEIFGLKRGGEDAAFWAEFATKPVTLCLCAPDKRSKWRSQTAIAFVVDDVYKAVEALRKRGVKILMPAETTGVRHMAFIADPDGNRFVCINVKTARPVNALPTVSPTPGTGIAGRRFCR
jgi:predicted enzyme related to lactoylglutathione lyase